MARSGRPPHTFPVPNILQIMTRFTGFPGLLDGQRDAAAGLLPRPMN